MSLDRESPSAFGLSGLCFLDSYDDHCSRRRLSCQSLSRRMGFWVMSVISLRLLSGHATGYMIGGLVVVDA